MSLGDDTSSERQAVESSIARIELLVDDATRLMDALDPQVPSGSHRDRTPDRAAGDRSPRRVVEQLRRKVDEQRGATAELATAVRELVAALERDRARAAAGEAAAIAAQRKAEHRPRIGTICGVGGLIAGVAGVLATLLVG